MTEDFIGKIELEIGFCEKSSDLSLFKETTITEVIVPGEDGVTENEQVEVECHVMKGSFETEVSFMLMSGDEEDHERTFNMTARADNDMTDVYKATVAFKREDQGKKLCCQALQKTGDQEIGNVTKVIYVHSSSIIKTYMYFRCPTQLSIFGFLMNLEYRMTLVI